MKIYIAGPYSKGDVEKNGEKALRLADYLANLGLTPYVPHLTHFWHLLYPRPYEWWLKYDLEWLPKCDCVVRMFGDSSGADGEVEYASKLGMPHFIFYGFEGNNLSNLDEWLARIERDLEERKENA